MLIVILRKRKLIQDFHLVWTILAFMIIAYNNNNINSSKDLRYIAKVIKVQRAGIRVINLLIVFRSTLKNLMRELIIKILLTM